MVAYIVVITEDTRIVAANIINKFTSFAIQEMKPMIGVKINKIEFAILTFSHCVPWFVTVTSIIFSIFLLLGNYLIIRTNKKFVNNKATK